jgi:beta-phosphoglucomutase
LKRRPRAEVPGSIFAVDGVLVDSPHEKAWRESLRELMESGWRGIRDHGVADGGQQR